MERFPSQIACHAESVSISWRHDIFPIHRFRIPVRGANNIQWAADQVS